MIIQAGTAFADVTREFLAAAWHAEGRADGVDHLLRSASAAVGAEILCAVVLDAVRKRDPRICLAQVEPQIGIALVILQQDVVLGHIVLDERAFEHQRLELRGRADRLEMVDERDHAARLRIVGGRILKVLADAVLQFFRLADVDDRIARVLHQIDAGLIRQRQRGLFQFFPGHRRSSA